MPNEKLHISFQKMEYERKRQKRAAVVAPPTRNYQNHANKLKQSIENIRKQFATSQDNVSVMKPLQVIRVGQDQKLDEESLRRSGFIFLDADTDKKVILVAKEGLVEIERKVDAYSQGVPTGQKSPKFNAIIAALSGDIDAQRLENRIGPRLDKIVIDSEQEYRLDVELFDTYDQVENDERVDTFDRFVRENNGRITDRYVKSGLFLFRIRVRGELVKLLLNDNNVRKIDLPPEPSFEAFNAARTSLNEFHEVPRPPDGSPGICIIDSGILTQHPLLKPAIGDTKAFHKDLSNGIDEYGHGTLVAGVALYGDVRQCIDDLNFEPKLYLYGARVLNKENKFDDDRLIVSQVEEAIRYFHRTYDCRVFNLSIADPEQIYADKKPSAWAHVLDLLATELDIVIVAAAGNIALETNLRERADHIREHYPSYLLSGLDKEADTRILEPATASNILTVGALAHADQSYSDAHNPGDLIQSLASIDGPSPFTRCGPGVNKAIKPEVCEYGGNMLWRRLHGSINHDSQLGIISTHKDYLDRLFGADIGTSLAAPKVAHLAALILQHYPNASANLIRALIANSASTPQTIQNLVDNGFIAKGDILKLCGYGKPDLSRAVFSDDTRVTLVADETIPLDGIHLYEIPIPDEYKELKGRRQISVTLAFDPPTRRTRYDYMGTKMSFRLFRGLEPEQIIRHFSEGIDENETDDIQNKHICKMDPSPAYRENGTLQKGIFAAKQNTSFTDYDEHGGNFYLLVVCRSVWATQHEVPRNRYALAVTIEHKDGMIDLYNLVNQKIQNVERIRVRG